MASPGVDARPEYRSASGDPHQTRRPDAMGNQLGGMLYAPYFPPRREDKVQILQTKSANRRTRD
jgi:hypothetical protein